MFSGYKSAKLVEKQNDLTGLNTAVYHSKNNHHSSELRMQNMFTLNVEGCFTVLKGGKTTPRCFSALRLANSERLRNGSYQVA